MASTFPKAILVQLPGVSLRQSLKVKHCGMSPSLSVTARLQGWSGYCHRCQETFWEPRKSMVSLEELTAREVPKVPSLPSDMQTTPNLNDVLSSTWLLWVLRCGLSLSMRKAYKIGFSTYFQKGIVPIYRKDTLEAVLFRKILSEDTSPKWRLVSRNPEQQTFDSIRSRAQLLAENGGASPTSYRVDCVVVEDAMSAMRVGEFLPTSSLCGTSIGAGKLERMLSHSGMSAPRVGVWLDPDTPGQTAAAKIVRSLRLMGVNTVELHSPRDPKNLTDYEIKRRLCDYRCYPAQGYEDPQGLQYVSTDRTAGRLE